MDRRRVATAGLAMSLKVIIGGRGATVSAAVRHHLVIEMTAPRRSAR